MMPSYGVAQFACDGVAPHEEQHVTDSGNLGEAAHTNWQH